MGNKFNNIMEKIYSIQYATIRVNNQQMNKFQVQKGTRQGCPLSPLLFISVLEVLLKEVQNSKEINGKTFKFKYRAYTDDVGFFC